MRRLDDRYFDDAASTRFLPAMVYGMKALRVAARLALHRARVWPWRRLSS